MSKTLLMDLKVGQSLSIDGGRVVVTLEEKSGQLAKLRFVHDDVLIERAAPKRRQGSTGADQARRGIRLAA
jgi:hypothetical protein